MAGDNTVKALEEAIQEISRIDDADERFVVLVSEANLRQYGIEPEHILALIRRNPDVNVRLIFVGSLQEEASQLVRVLAGHAFLCSHASDLPKIIKSILSSELEKA